MSALERVLAAAPGAVLWSVRWHGVSFENETEMFETPRAALELFTPGPRLLVAWRRKRMSDAEVWGVVDDWIERAQDWYQEEFGDENGDPPEFDPATRGRLFTIASVALRAQTPWQYEEIAQIELTAEEVAEIVGGEQ